MLQFGLLFQASPNHATLLKSPENCLFANRGLFDLWSLVSISHSPVVSVTHTLHPALVGSAGRTTAPWSRCRGSTWTQGWVSSASALCCRAPPPTTTRTSSLPSSSICTRYLKGTCHKNGQGGSATLLCPHCPKTGTGVSEVCGLIRTGTVWSDWP